MVSAAAVTPSAPAPTHGNGSFYPPRREGEIFRFDEGRDGFLDLNEVKRMMERLGAPQTHLGLKAMIAEVDEDKDNKISFREFLLIYRKARAGELESDSGLDALARLTEINVDQVGVNGAKNFFEAKIEELSKANKFHDEIIQEQEAKKREAEERALRRQQFKEKAAVFQH
ncbi:EF-hand domain-containing protein D2 homolog [Eumeta japonica]|uniref:EF-hand domain-containing protein D2 homolog n=1 Tax=Eumeta variegata TaxID=151549 RepID=A0A4C1UKL1_EUMVA|nr:EF-hand domain-containing protein D2 homolog [Eumeta japonica]